jgi:hypothetical protein
VKQVRAVRILRAERQGSSWPVLAETEAGSYLVKLRGAAQGTAPLVAEIVAGAVAEALGLNLPGRCLVLIDQQTERHDRHEELLDLIDRSEGVNLGLSFVEGAREYQPADAVLVTAEEASKIVWFDRFIGNLDRTAANPNLLVRGGVVWLIDHGAALPFAHDWGAVSESSPRRVFAGADSHPLRGRATMLAQVDAACAAALTRPILRAALDEVPDSFLQPLLPPFTAGGSASVSRRREAYVAFLWKRLASPRPFVAAGR